MNCQFPSSSISRSTWQFVTLQTGPLAKVVLSSMTRAATLSPTIFDISSQHSYFHRGGLVSYYVCIVWSLLADCHIYDKLFSLRIEHGGTLVFKRSPIYSTAPRQMSKILVCRWPPAIRGVWPVATLIIETIRETTSYFNSFFFIEVSLLDSEQCSRWWRLVDISRWVLGYKHRSFMCILRYQQRGIICIFNELSKLRYWVKKI